MRARSSLISRTISTIEAKGSSLSRCALRRYCRHTHSMSSPHQSAHGKKAIGAPPTWGEQNIQKMGSWSRPECDKLQSPFHKAVGGLSLQQPMANIKVATPTPLGDAMRSGCGRIGAGCAHRANSCRQIGMNQQLVRPPADNAADQRADDGYPPIMIGRRKG